MKFDIKNKKTRLLVALVAGAAAVLATAYAYQQPTTALVRNMSPLIDFIAFPERDVIELSKGGTLTVPIRIESPRDAEYTLSLSVVPNYVTEGGIVNRTTDELLRDRILMTLSGESVTLSPQDTSIIELGLGWVERDSGIVLTVTVAPDAEEGTYSYALETRRVSADGRTQGTSAFFTVTVR